MTDYKRVQREDGVKVTVAHVREGMKVVDEPAVDRNGRPLDASYPASPPKPKAPKPSAVEVTHEA